MAEARFRLRIEYDGGRFAGFQRQRPQGPPTVQGELERAFSRLLGHEVVIRGAGRTDAGVHATGQVVAFETHRPRPEAVLLKGGNALLPRDIRVLEVAPACAGFHPRFSARSRTYHYLLVPWSRPELWFRGRAWQVPEGLDLGAMRRAAAALVGWHDFSAFCSQVPKGESRVRHLMELEILEAGGEAWPLLWPGGPAAVGLRVRANGFLRRMVRLLTAGLVAVGLGEWEEGRPERVLLGKDPAQALPPAPPGGLYLTAVEYPPEILRGPALASEGPGPGSPG